MRVVVTGATGFLGGVVSRRLTAAGHSVLATGRNVKAGEQLQAEGIAFRFANIEEPESLFDLCEGANAVVHCAALASPWGPRKRFYAVNVQGTEHVVQSCLKAGVSRLVHISTPSVYVDGKARYGVREDDILPRPMNAYAETKRLAEEVVGAVSSSLATVILRPRALIGPGDTVLLPRLIHALKTGRLPIIGSKEVQTDLTVVDNAAQAVLLALETNTVGGTYNITNGEPLPLWDLVAQLCDDLDLQKPQRQMSYRFAWLLAAGLELTHRIRPSLGEPPLTRYSVALMGRTLTLDISSARQDLGYQPEVSIKHGLERFVRWWQGQQ